jgi:hypothetical protein
VAPPLVKIKLAFNSWNIDLFDAGRLVKVPLKVIVSDCPGAKVIDVNKDVLINTS